MAGRSLRRLCFGKPCVRFHHIDFDTADLQIAYQCVFSRREVASYAKCGKGGSFVRRYDCLRGAPRSGERGHEERKGRGWVAICLTGGLQATRWRTPSDWREEAVEFPCVDWGGALDGRGYDSTN